MNSQTLKGFIANIILSVQNASSQSYSFKILYFKGFIAEHVSNIEVDHENFCL